MPRLAVLFERVGPYHRARLKAAGKLGNVVAIELSSVDDTYAWDRLDGTDGFDRVTLFHDRAVTSISGRRMSCEVTSTLDRINPDVVAVPGWSERGALAALRWALRRERAVVLMSASTEWDTKRVLWKEAAKKRIVRLNDCALVGGMRHKEYLSKLGLPRELTFAGYDVVDNEYFRGGAEAARQNSLSVSARLGLPTKFFLSSCRFIPKKNLIRLMEAYGRYVRLDATDPWSFVLLGDGPLQSELENCRQMLGLESLFLMSGFKQYDELPNYYGLASAFILASTSEQWGLVVNEAMASGLPVVVSDRCGCTPDLVRAGMNGFTFDPYDVGALSQLMLDLSSGKYNLTAMGTASAEIVSQWSPERFAENLWKAVEVAWSVPRRKVSVTDRTLLWALIHR